MYVEAQKMHILLAEDNDDHAELILSCLEDFKADTHVVKAIDGEQALDYLLRRGAFSDPSQSPRPDLILLDLRMPKIDGLEVLRHIKSTERLKRIPVVILTTSNAETDVAKAYDYHANSYLVKPDEFGKLYDLLRELEFYWLETNRSAKTNS